MRYRLLGVILLIILATPATHAQQGVFLIRHAEQVLDVEDPPLTEDGLGRAKTWATIFRDAGIKVIYTSKKVRTKQTGEAIAQKLNLPLETVPRRDVTGLVDRIRKEHADDVVLIISHSITIPKLVGAFAPFVEPPRIERDDYDSLFVIVPEGEDDARVLRLRY